jgi:hypothetical protein
MHKHTATQYVKLQQPREMNITDNNNTRDLHKHTATHSMLNYQLKLFQKLINNLI